jgi:glycosyltransferase involved in cell wall biosynthesis
VIVTPSQYLARAVELHGLTARVIPNVIDLNQYPFRRREAVQPRLLWMRSFHDVYNPAMAVRALAALKKDAPEATLVMAGQDKGLQKDMLDLAAKLGVGGSVSFVGFLDKPAKFRAGTQADIFINTSRTDNMPVAHVEACAMGLPVITTNVGGIPDLMTDGATALFVPDDDHEALARRILDLLHNPELALRLSSNGRELALRSSWDNVREQWESLFAELMRSKNKRTQTCAA